MAEERETIETKMWPSETSFISPSESKKSRLEENLAKENKRKREAWKEEDALMKEVDMMIEEARHSAAKEQGSDAAHSQWEVRVQTKVSELLASTSSRFVVSDLGRFLEDVLNDVEWQLESCRSGSTIGKRDLFPIPVSGIPRESHPNNPFLRATITALNSMYGRQAAEDYSGNKATERVVKRLAEVVREHPLLHEEIPPFTFDDFYSSKGLDYHGDEVQLARKVTWESIEPSLPKEVGSLDIRHFCTGGVLHYINNFTDFLIPKEQQLVCKSPRVMVENEDWLILAKGLVDRGLCEIKGKDSLYQVGGNVLHNGMFAVSKQEFQGNVEICRLIMNLKPVNSLCSSLTADTPSLPSVTLMTGFYLGEDEVLTLSSEDIRCFFYLFQVPREWTPFMSFGKRIPKEMVPDGLPNDEAYLCARVLPMGFINSVGIAQHIHRNVIKNSLGNFTAVIGGESEVRRDRPLPQGKDLFRVYLDNFDELQRVDKRLAERLAGEVSPLAQEVREAYLAGGLPRHPKKSVSQQLEGEVQGAWMDGVRGMVLAKPSKIVRYIRLALEVLGGGKASQKELQVIGGGLVYVSMYRRPALAGLNHLWRMIVDLDKKPKGIRVSLRREVVLEVARFLGLLPLMFMDFRLPFDTHVTASDASTTGGGVCVTHSLTPYGKLASEGLVRGDTYEGPHQCQILSIGLIDGISALRIALDGLQAPMVGHVSVELQPEARRVVESFFPDTEFLEDVNAVTDEVVKGWSLKYGTAGLVLVGSGPPCQGVSGLNADRRGALRDFRSRLFKHVPRIVKDVKRHFPWAQVHNLSENVASMDANDCGAMNEEYDDQPWFIDSCGISLARRPRLYWVSWELIAEPGVSLEEGSDHALPIKGQVTLKAEVNPKDFVEAGWELPNSQVLPTFTTARPSDKPLRKPAGLHLCEEHEVARWKADDHRYPPYQYRDVHTLANKNGERRPASVQEREAILGFPLNYTKQCMSKKDHDSSAHKDCRLSLLGNSWSVPVVAWILKNLLVRLGLIQPLSLQQLVDRFTPGKASSLQGLLLRPPVNHSTKSEDLKSALVQKLFGLTSLTGEDLMIHGESEAPVRFQRLRGSVPARLWRWKPVAGWKWKNMDEHINALELRAVFTCVKWRVEQLQQQNTRFVHLVDSLVSLHSLTRGRSSSRKLRRTVMKINSYLLASGLQGLWAYVDTKQNPADRPSRWAGSRKWVRKRQK